MRPEFFVARRLSYAPREGKEGSEIVKPCAWFQVFMEIQAHTKPFWMTREIKFRTQRLLQHLTLTSQMVGELMVPMRLTCMMEQ